MMMATATRRAKQGIGGVTLELLKDGVATGITTVTSNAPGRSAITSSSI